jgi:hypothetical protein
MVISRKRNKPYHPLCLGHHYAIWTSDSNFLLAQNFFFGPASHFRHCIQCNQYDHSIGHYLKLLHLSINSFQINCFFLSISLKFILYLVSRGFWGFSKVILVQVCSWNCENTPMHILLSNETWIFLFGMNNQLTLPRTGKLFYFKITSS